ncbi:hypothetical protein Syn7502_00827 [Synechococcus sp. PCC 7502]|uniref:hypothetical protein n=1 Tax=Synechococcus sp. PCC 7502 TaxID=1173263 RepID=UPI00029FB416|nr:hypothetical protein [Synechococcus sp. PCC 7502]AFY72959.1 hypothetical protein Syn7502_00827 [Synechococcus sp. PCC 7502]
MTAITLSTDIPSNITTLEQLHVWTSVALATCNPTKQIVESENSTEFTCRYFVALAYDATTRCVDRISIPIDPTYVSDKSKKFWMFANPISDTALPSTFKAN